MARTEPPLSRPRGPADWTVLVGLGLVLLVAVGSFLAGRNSVTTDRGGVEGSTRSLVADVLGSTEVMATVSFDDDTSAVVACSLIEAPDGDRADIRVIHIAPHQGGEQILSFRHLASAEACGSCTTTQAQLDGESMLLGHCVFDSAGPSPVPFPRRVRTTSAFVVSAPAAAGESAIGMDLLCGITTLSIHNGELRLDATQPLYAANPNPPLPLPPMRFTRYEGVFEADDIGVLDHFCEVTPDTQLVELPAFVFLGQKQRELSHLVVDSEIGKIGFRGPVLIGLTANQCSRLLRSQFAQGFDDAEPQTMASITGLEPPDGYDDWFFACQIDDSS